MRVVLFGQGPKATAVLQKLIDLGQEVVGVFVADVDKHEKVNYKKPLTLAMEHFIPDHYRGGSDEKVLRELMPDIIFVVGWRYKIPKEQYSIPSKGTIVFHDSLLPKYRGFAPTNWAIINGETKTGATMFYIDEGIDSGDIIGQAEIPITLDDDAKTVETKVTSAYVGLLETYLPLIKADRVNRKPQDGRQATYTCKRIPEDGLIDWGKSTRKILNLIRGTTDPYPGAFTYLHDNNKLCKLMIWKASLDGEWKDYVGRIHGRVVDIIKGRGVVALTGGGTILIEEVSIGNGDHVRADEIIKSIKITLSPIDK